jgi:hypothetical protein
MNTIMNPIIKIDHDVKFPEHISDNYHSEGRVRINPVKNTKAIEMLANPLNFEKWNNLDFIKSYIQNDAFKYSSIEKYLKTIPFEKLVLIGNVPKFENRMRSFEDAKKKLSEITCGLSEILPVGSIVGSAITCALDSKFKSDINDIDVMITFDDDYENWNKKKAFKRIVLALTRKANENNENVEKEIEICMEKCKKNIRDIRERLNKDLKKTNEPIDISNIYKFYYEEFSNEDEWCEKKINKLRDKMIQFVIPRQENNQKYQLYWCEKRIEIFYSREEDCFEELKNFHLPITRGLYINGEFFITLSLISAIETNSIYDFVWWEHGTKPIDAISKYAYRGYDFYLPKSQHEEMNKCYCKKKKCFYSKALENIHIIEDFSNYYFKNSIFKIMFEIPLTRIGRYELCTKKIERNGNVCSINIICINDEKIEEREFSIVGKNLRRFDKKDPRRKNGRFILRSGIEKNYWDKNTKLLMIVD